MIIPRLAKAAEEETPVVAELPNQASQQSSPKTATESPAPAAQAEAAPPAPTNTTVSTKNTLFAEERVVDDYSRSHASSTDGESEDAVFMVSVCVHVPESPSTG